MDLAKDGCLSDIETLGRDVRKQQNKQEASIGRLRDMVGNTLKDQIVDSMRQVPPPPLRYNEGELLKKKKNPRRLQTRHPKSDRDARRRTSETTSRNADQRSSSSRSRTASERL
jgi:hypothetical protein